MFCTGKHYPGAQYDPNTLKFKLLPMRVAIVSSSEKRRAVVTALMGSYELPLEQPLAARSHAAFICLTDDPDLSSDSWEVIHIKPDFPGDSVRSARSIKLRGHAVLDQFDETLWIDNRVILKKDPIEFFDKFLGDVDLALPAHSMRNTVIDEFRAVITSAFDDPKRVRQQLAYYQDQFPELLEAQPFWTGMLLRKRSDATSLFGRIWMDQILLHSRRDQLSVNFSMMLSGVKSEVIPIDNLESEWHRWVPVGEIARDKTVSNWASKRFRYPRRAQFVDSLRATTLGRKSLRILERLGIETHNVR
jgi:hypothetical protein